MVGTGKITKNYKTYNRLRVAEATVGIVTLGSFTEMDVLLGIVTLVILACAKTRV